MKHLVVEAREKKRFLVQFLSKETLKGTPYALRFSNGPCGYTQA